MSQSPQQGLMPLAFNDSLVRVRKDEQGNPWFIVKDVCAVLDLSNVTEATRSLDEDERGSVILNTLGGEQEMLTVSESGLYSLIFRSRKVGEQAVARYQREMQAVTEPPLVKLFWQQFHALNVDGRLNHARNPELIALRLAEVVKAAKAKGICPFTVTELRRVLPLGGTYRLMAANRAVRSVHLGKAVRCMVFFGLTDATAEGGNHE